jgi:hypothetical protein
MGNRMDEGLLVGSLVAHSDVRVCTDNGHHNGLFAGFSGQKHVKIGPLVEYDVHAHLESGKAAHHEPQ